MKLFVFSKWFQSAVIFVLVIMLAGCGTPNIERLEETRDVDRLIEMLDHEDPLVVIGAAGALGRIGGRSSARSLSGLIYNHPDISVKMAAIEALGQLQDPAGAERLVSALQLEDLDLRDSIIETLSLMGSSAVEPLIEPLQGDDPADIDLLRLDGVVAALVLMGDEAVDPLLHGLREGPIHAREYLTFVLDAIGWQPGADIHAAYYWIAKQAWEECAKVGEAAIVPLIQVSKDDDLGLQEMALLAIGQIRDPRSVDPLISILADRNVDSSHPALLNKDVKLRAAAAEALVGIGGEKVMAALLAALQYTEAELRDTVLESLSLISAPMISNLEPTLAILAPVCQQNGEVGIFQLDENIPELFYPLVMLDRAGQVNEWTSVFILREAKTTPIENLLLACMEISIRHVETCYYMGARNIDRYSEEITIDLREASSGARMTYEVFLGRAEDCPGIRSDWDPDELHGRVALEEINAWLAEFLP